MRDDRYLNDHTRDRAVLSGLNKRDAGSQHYGSRRSDGGGKLLPCADAGGSVSDCEGGCGVLNPIGGKRNGDNPAGNVHCGRNGGVVAGDGRDEIRRKNRAGRKERSAVDEGISADGRKHGDLLERDAG